MNHSMKKLAVLLAAAPLLLCAPLASSADASSAGYAGAFVLSEAEVDQMVLAFPCMSDSAVVLDDDGRELFCTHGHVFGAGKHNSTDRVPQLPEGSALLFGHTHIKVNEESTGHPGLWLFNPGSVSIPKDGSNSCGIYESGLPLCEAFRHITLD